MKSLIANGIVTSSLIQCELEVREPLRYQFLAAGWRSWNSVLLAAVSEWLDRELDVKDSGIVMTNARYNLRERSDVWIWIYADAAAYQEVVEL